MLNSRGQSPSESQDLSSEDMNSNDQKELSRYKRLYSQAREDLEKLNGQAKRRCIKNVPPAICAHEITGKLVLAGRN